MVSALCARGERMSMKVMRVRVRANVCAEWYYQCVKEDSLVEDGMMEE
jgi:hypothetical protein